MSNLTREYFDETITEMKGETKEEIHDLATMVAKGFSDVEKRLDVRERVENKMGKVESALNIRL